MNLRLKNLFEKLQQKDIDGLIVSSANNISYLTNYLSRDSYLLACRKENIYFTDSRYIEEAKKFLQTSAKLKKINGSVFQLIADACLSLKLRRIGFEERSLTFAEHKKIKGCLNKKADLVPTHSLIEELRQIKEPAEIKKIRKAAKIASSALKFIKNRIFPGQREIEVVAELERFIRYHGASNSAFDIIVASGPNSSFPHHISSERKIRKNEPVLIDIGVDYLGYKSDLTRVFFLDRINSLTQKIYDIVSEAQKKAIEKVRPAERIAKVDAAARNHIAQNGFGEFFGHNVGHGVGLDVHEEPHISGKENKTLRAGMVFTVEPAIYLPAKFGIRIEDMVLVTHNACEVLSGSINK